jgi:lipopolysaccharide assembly outer membrane protein LptD (OstA)
MNITRKGSFYLVLVRTENLSIALKQKYRQTLPDSPTPSVLFSRFLLISALIIGLNGALQAQTDSIRRADSLKKVNAQTVRIGTTLKDIVTYSAQDSMFFDLINQKVYLYDSAAVDYQDVRLRANYIVIDFKNSVVSAEGRKDSLGTYREKAMITQADQTFYGEKLSFNFETGKGKVTEVNTEEGGGFLLADAVKKDTGGVIYGYHGQFTTCDRPDHPHYAIRAKKMKIIQNDKIVTGPAYLEISDVPTPLAVPFGFFPNKKGRKSGILIPTYGESPSLGFFLKDGGYYWGVSDKMDMALRGDIYSKGSWGAKLYTNYKVRYKYSGNINLKFARILTGDRELPTSRIIRNDFFINWYHTQDPKFNPSIRFSANVNAGSSTYNSINSDRPQDYLSNIFSSNISASKSWKFGVLSTSLRHSQNTLTHHVDMTIPQIAFSVNRFYPFRNSKRVTNKWYDKIGVSYSSEFKNDLSIGDTMFRKEYRPYIKNYFSNGIRQSLPIATSFNVLKYFTLTPALNFNSVTQFRTILKTFNSDSNQVYTDTVNGTKINFDWSASVTLSTRLFGMYYMKASRFSVIRHTITPNLSFTYMPDFTNEKYGFYKTVQTNNAGNFEKYSIYEGGIYGSSPRGKLGSIGINILNTFEGKRRLKPTDSTGVAERVSLIDALNGGFSYNLIADSLNWSYLNAGLRMKLFKKIDFNASVIADPYKLREEDDGSAVRINQFEWQGRKRIARLTGANLTIGTNLRKGGLSSSAEHTSSRGTDAELNMINSNPNGYVDFNIPWSLNISFTLNYSKPLLQETFSQSLHVGGDVNVTPKWKVGFDSNYDLQHGQFAYASLNAYRDLHCWELQFNWIPFGVRQSYNVTLNVKSAVLQDLRLTRKRDWYDFSGR